MTPPAFSLDMQPLDVSPMRTKAAKDSKLLANAQLVIEQKHVQMLERKVKRQRDEFLFKIFLILIQRKLKGGLL